MDLDHLRDKVSRFVQKTRRFTLGDLARAICENPVILQNLLNEFIAEGVIRKGRWIFHRTANAIPSAS